MSTSKLLPILILLASLSSQIANASYQRGNCDLNLMFPEFASLPDDANLGMITDRVRMTPEALQTAYMQGIFPWHTTEEGTSAWHSPSMRGILALDQVHISTKDMKFIRKALESGEYRVTFDQAFTEVMEECARMVRWVTHPITKRKVPDGHWISSQFLTNYPKLFAAGKAHSVEVWHNDILVGGLYGTYIGGVFAGESMFHKEDDVTKLALYKLIERLKANGHTFIDTQQARGLVLKWGAQLIPRGEFMNLLYDAQQKDLLF